MEDGERLPHVFAEQGLRAQKQERQEKSVSWHKMLMPKCQNKIKTSSIYKNIQLIYMKKRRDAFPYSKLQYLYLMNAVSVLDFTFRKCLANLIERWDVPESERLTTPTKQFFPRRTLQG